MAVRVTMDDIAEYAKVSKYAVSKALSGQSGVSEQTRGRIIGVAKELGYFDQRRVQVKYSRSAQPMEEMSKRLAKRSIMVLMPNIRMQNMDSHYWGRIVDGIADELKKYNLFMIIATEYSEVNYAGLINVQELIGVIVVGSISSDMLQEVGKTKLPVIIVDHEDASFHCDSIFVDNLDAAKRMTTHLLGRGHTSLQFIGDVHFARSFQERWIGYRTALEESELPLRQDERLLRVQSLVIDKTRQQIRECLVELLESEQMPSAFVCANDEIAIATIETLRLLHVEVPERVSVTGFDNIDESEHVVPALTTMNVVKEELGRRSVEMLLRRQSQPKAMMEKVLLLTELICRQSTADVAMLTLMK